jgi:TolA-binding protein
MRSNDFSYFIETYNSGEMNDTEKQEFEIKLGKNEMLRREAGIRKATDEILARKDIISLRNRLSAIENSRKSRKSLISTKIPSYVKYVAAGIIAILFIGSASLYFTGSLSSEQIINRYYKTYSPPSAQRSGVTADNRDFKLALQLYNKQEYTRAAVLFSKVVQSNPKDMQSELLSGLSNFEIKKYPEASRSFKNVIDDNNNYFIETAQWYLALCYIRTDEKEKALQQLEKLRKDRGLYSNDAKKVIRKYR